MNRLRLWSVTAVPLDQKRVVVAHPSTEISSQAAEETCTEKSPQLDALRK